MATNFTSLDFASAWSKRACHFPGSVPSDLTLCVGSGSAFATVGAGLEYWAPSGAAVARRQRARRLAWRMWTSVIGCRDSGTVGRVLTSEVALADDRDVMALVAGGDPGERAGADDEVARGARARHHAGV